MNKRIRELAEQADIKFRISSIDPQFWSDKEESLEKFAELIVRECIVDFYRNCLDTTSDDDITEQVDRYVKQSFGVE